MITRSFGTAPLMYTHVSLSNWLGDKCPEVQSSHMGGSEREVKME